MGRQKKKKTTYMKQYLMQKMGRLSGDGQAGNYYY